MGFFSEFKKASRGEEAGDEYLVADKRVVCPHCGGTHFYEGSALLDKRGSSMLGLEWLGGSATTLTCVRCGHVEWFANNGIVERLR